MLLSLANASSSRCPGGKELASPVHRSMATSARNLGWHPVRGRG
jgi:hypothetical protein